MRVTAKVDYAVRAMLELASEPGRSVKLDRLAEAQDLPPRFLEHILTDLRRADLVVSQRGSRGGYRLSRPAQDITVADVIRAVEGPLANVQGVRPESVAYEGVAAPLRQVWVATRAALRSVLEVVTLDSVLREELPEVVTRLTDDPEAWARR